MVAADFMRIIGALCLLYKASLKKEAQVSVALSCPAARSDQLSEVPQSMPELRLSLALAAFALAAFALHVRWEEGRKMARAQNAPHHQCQVLSAYISDNLRDDAN